MNNDIDYTKEVSDEWNKAGASENFRDYIAQGFPEENGFRESGKICVQRLSKYINDKNIYLKGKKILELGCGAGRMTEHLSKLVKWIFAVDISVEMISRLEERLDDRRNIKTLLNSDIGCCVPDRYIDMVICDIVFQHNTIEEVYKLMELCKNKIINNGYFIFFIPIENEHKSEKFFLNNEVTLRMERWTKQEIIDMANKLDYKIVYIPDQSEINNIRQYCIFKKVNHE
jgi:ubiquinone/menaquinone biosynthesis C-methylase UbiE